MGQLRIFYIYTKLDLTRPPHPHHSYRSLSVPLLRFFPITSPKSLFSKIHSQNPLKKTLKWVFEFFFRFSPIRFWKKKPESPLRFQNLRNNFTQAVWIWFSISNPFSLPLRRFLLRSGSSSSKKKSNSNEAFSVYLFDRGGKKVNVKKKWRVFRAMLGEIRCGFNVESCFFHLAEWHPLQ